jgi:hypothetical protein
MLKMVGGCCWCGGVSLLSIDDDALSRSKEGQKGRSATAGTGNFTNSLLCSGILISQVVSARSAADVRKSGKAGDSQLARS